MKTLRSLLLTSGIGLFCWFAVISFSHSASAQTLPPARFEDSFQIGRDRFLIKVKKSFITLAFGQFGEKIEFSVFKNGKFIHPTDRDGGTLIGCRQPFTQPKDRNPIQKLDLSGGTVQGWWLSTGESCGNRSMQRFLAIRPTPDGTYKSMTTISSSGIFARQVTKGKGIEVWTVRHQTDCGAWTRSYPKYQVLDGHPKLPEDRAQWPKYSDFGIKNTETIYPVDYVDLFVSGVANRDVHLLKAALTEFKKNGIPKPDDNGRDCYPEFLPKTEKDIQKIIDAYTVLDQVGLLDTEKFL
jgi:hypothetical protein